MAVDITGVAPHFPEVQWRAMLIPAQYTANALAMLRLAEAARAAGGDVPVNVTSWYRNGVVNALSGGNKGSQHLTASAMDFVPSGDMKRWFERVAANLPADTFGQLIFERNHVHLSLPNRASGKRGEVLVEPTEGSYVPYAGTLPDDDRGEGSRNMSALVLALALVVILLAAS